MKFSKLFLIPLLALSLAACNTTDQSGNGGNGDTGGEVTPVTAWTEAELALMKEHLNENVLPWLGITGGTWAYDETEGALVFTKANGTEAELTAAKAALIAAQYAEEGEGTEKYLAKYFNEYLGEGIYVEMGLTEGTLKIAAEYDEGYPGAYSQELVNAWVKKALGAESTYELPLFGGTDKVNRMMDTKLDFGIKGLADLSTLVLSTAEAADAKAIETDFVAKLAAAGYTKKVAGGYGITGFPIYYNADDTVGVVVVGTAMATTAFGAPSLGIGLFNVEEGLEGTAIPKALTGAYAGYAEEGQKVLGSDAFVANITPTSAIVNGTELPFRMIMVDEKAGAIMCMAVAGEQIMAFTIIPTDFGVLLGIDDITGDKPVTLGVANQGIPLSIQGNAISYTEFGIESGDITLGLEILAPGLLINGQPIIPEIVATEAGGLEIHFEYQGGTFVIDDETNMTRTDVTPAKTSKLDYLESADLKDIVETSYQGTAPAVIPGYGDTTEVALEISKYGVSLNDKALAVYDYSVNAMGTQEFIVLIGDKLAVISIPAEGPAMITYIESGEPVTNEDLINLRAPKPIPEAWYGKFKATNSDLDSRIDNKEQFEIVVSADGVTLDGEPCTKVVYNDLDGILCTTPGGTQINIFAYYIDTPNMLITLDFENKFSLEPISDAPVTGIPEKYNGIYKGNVGGVEKTLKILADGVTYDGTALTFVKVVNGTDYYYKDAANKEYNLSTTGAPEGQIVLSAGDDYGLFKPETPLFPAEKFGTYTGELASYMDETADPTPVTLVIDVEGAKLNGELLTLDPEVAPEGNTYYFVNSKGQFINLTFGEAGFVTLANNSAQCSGVLEMEGASGETTTTGIPEEKYGTYTTTLGGNSMTVVISADGVTVDGQALTLGSVEGSDYYYIDDAENNYTISVGEQITMQLNGVIGNLTLSEGGTEGGGETTGPTIPESACGRYTGTLDYGTIGGSKDITIIVSADGIMLNGEEGTIVNVTKWEIDFKIGDVTYRLDIDGFSFGIASEMDPNNSVPVVNRTIYAQTVTKA